MTSLKCAVLMAGLLGCGLTPAYGQTLIVGNDEKQGVDQNFKPILREPGHDTLSVIDISKPDTPQITATIPLVNSVVGPPTNLAVTPSGDMALVANSLAPVVQGWGHQLEPDNKVFVVDLKASPPKIVATVTVGKQPSGLAIGPKGDMALVANRADGTISVLSIHGKDVLVTDTVPVGAAADLVSAVAITPDGKRALAVKAAANKVALLTIDGDKVTYDKRDLPTGILPYNVAITPDGKLALTADNGGRRQLRRECRHGRGHRPRRQPAAGRRPCHGWRFAGGAGDQPQGQSRGIGSGGGLEHPEPVLYHHAGGSVAVLAINGDKVTKSARHGRRAARGRRVQRRRKPYLCRQFPRRRPVGTEG